MSSNSWEIQKLGDICTKIGSGATPRGGKEVYLDEGPVALIRSQNVLDFSFSYDGLAYIDKEQAAQLSNVEIEKDDVLLNITGDSVARVCQVPNEILPARVNQHVSIIRPNKQRLDNQFLKYYLLDPQIKKQLLAFASVGATRKALTKGMIEDFDITLPDLPTQKRIAGILSALDEKIELNRQTNATLEAIAQAIFKEWFVHYNYPGATGVLVDSELGAIPAGWRVGNILEIATLLSGGTPSTRIEEYWNGKLDWVSAKDVSNSNHSFILETERKITQAGLANSSTKLLPRLTTIITARGSVGNYAILSKPMTMNQTNYGLKAKVDGADYLIFFALGNLVSQLQKASYGTIFDTITTRTFEHSLLVIPPVHLIQLFNETISPLLDDMLCNLEEASTLAQIRDTLLPKLMRGEVVV